MSQEILPPGMRDPARRTLSSPALKDYATIEKYSRETNGEYTRFIGGVKVGGGNPYVLFIFTIATSCQVIGSDYRFSLPSNADSLLH